MTIISPDEKITIMQAAKGSQPARSMARMADAMNVALTGLPERNSQTISWMVPTGAVTGTTMFLTGQIFTQAAGLTATYETAFSAGGQFIGLNVTGVVGGGGSLIVRGQVISTTGAPVDFTETIPVTSTGLYVTSNRWYEIISVTRVGLITYDIRVFGFLSMGNTDYRILGYRAEFQCVGNNPDIALRIRRVRDLGGGKYDLVLLEHLGIDSTASGGVQTDTARSGTRDYTFSSEAWDNGRLYVMRFTDFQTYFTNGEAEVLGATKNEGIIIDFLGEPDAGMNSVEWVTLSIFIEEIL